MRNMLKEWIEGNITITIRGKRFERLINLAVRDNIYMWNIMRMENETGRCDMMISDYFRLRPLLKETGCRAHVERRDGLPFWMMRIRMRAGFAIGVVLFLLGLYMLTSLVWEVEVKGTHLISAYEVGQAAEKVGIKRFAWKGNLKDPQILQRKLLTLIPEASWVGVEIEGTKAIIQVVEKEEQERQKAVGPRNMVAIKKAVIHSIFAESGKTMVSPHQYVEKGQVLISGIIGNDMRQAVVAAKGKVEGEVWYVSNVSVPLTQTRYTYTGATQTRYYLHVGSYAVKLWPLQEEPLKQFETAEKRFQPSLFGMASPLAVKVENLHERQPQMKKITQEAAIEIAKRFAAADVLKSAGKDAKIQEEKVLQVKQENGKVYVSIHYAVIEDIATEQPIIALPPTPTPEQGRAN